MISKEDAVKKLKEDGFSAVLEKGVVVFQYKTSEEYESLSSTARKVLDNIDYHASWGISPYKNNSLIENV